MSLVDLWCWTSAIISALVVSAVWLFALFALAVTQEYRRTRRGRYE